MSYNQDRTFFHSFAGDVGHRHCLRSIIIVEAALTLPTFGMQECMIGFVFSDESEAASFYKKVSNRAKHARQFLCVTMRPRF